MYIQNGIALRVGDNVQINIAMRVGAWPERIEVAAGAGMVQTQQNTISLVIDQQRIVELPLNGRDPAELITHSGAAVNKSDGTNTGSKSFFSSQSIAIAGGSGNTSTVKGHVDQRAEVEAVGGEGMQDLALRAVAGPVEVRVGKLLGIPLDRAGKWVYKAVRIVMQSVQPNNRVSRFFAERSADLWTRLQRIIADVFSGSLPPIERGRHAAC
jgi:hypothetical protein